MAGAPAGNSNAARANRLLTSALKRELTQNPDDVLLIARKLIESAKAGEPWAMTLIHDRVDGKAPQPVVGGDEDDPAVKVMTEITIRAVDANRPTTQSG
jgi:hypothetical protein